MLSLITENVFTDHIVQMKQTKEKIALYVTVLTLKALAVTSKKPLLASKNYE